MNKLLQLQDQMQLFLLSSHYEIKSSIVPTQSVSIEKRLSIYKDGYKLRLIECLSSNYPALNNLLGSEAFNALCERYIDTHPSHFRSIRWYGHSLSDFMKQDASYASTFLAELADFEWKMTLVFDAADDPVLQIVDMSSIPPEAWPGMQFIMHASLQRANYFWNGVSFWQALVQNEPLPEQCQNDESTAWLLWRNSDYLIRYCSLTDIEAWALDALLQGLSFGEICEGLCQWIAVEEVGMQAASYLKNWIQRGIVSQLLLLN